MRLGVLATVVGFCALVLLASASHASERVALVIGNGGYKHSTTLKNPANDATDVAVALKRLGFEVLVGTDLSSDDMRAVLREFGDKLEHAKIALFFYAGHGLQIEGDNYLVPVDAKLTKIADVSLDAIKLPQFFNRWNHSSAPVWSFWMPVGTIRSLKGWREAQAAAAPKARASVADLHALKAVRAQ